MPKLTADEVVTSKHIRSYIQYGGPLPGNQVAYYGQEAQYMVIEGVSAPELGGIEPTYVHDPRRPGAYRLVARKISPPDLASASFKFLEKHGAIPRQLMKQNCVFNSYQPVGKCKDPSDFLAGWSNYVLIYSRALTTNKDLGNRGQWDGDDQVEDTLETSLSDIYPIGPLAFGEKAAAQIDREVVDIVYGSNVQCGDCGDADDGTSRIYGVTKSSGGGSPGLPAEVVYTLNGGLVWLEATITGIGATADPTAVDIVGDKVVVVVTSENAYYWATLTNGIPGTFTKVTTGFVTNKQPTDIYVAGPRKVYLCGNGGYIYESTDITAGVTVIDAGSATTSNLNRIRGLDETIVAVGASSTVIYSQNRGLTFATVSNAPSAIATNITAVEVLESRRWWVGTELGRVLYTTNSAETAWVEKTFEGSGSGAVKDIVAATEEVLYFSFSTSTPTARVFASWNGGADFTRFSPRILNWPVFTHANRLAVPNVADAGVASNNLAVAGLSGGGTDGVIYLGIATKV